MGKICIYLPDVLTPEERSRGYNRAAALWTGKGSPYLLSVDRIALWYWQKTGTPLFLEAHETPEYVRVVERHVPVQVVAAVTVERPARKRKKHKKHRKKAGDGNAPREKGCAGSEMEPWLDIPERTEPPPIWDDNGWVAAAYYACHESRKRIDYEMWDECWLEAS